MVLAYFSGIRERQRLGSLQLSVGAAATIFDDENEEGLPSMSEENAELRRSKLFWLNAGLTIALMTGLVMEITQCPRASWQSGKPAPTRDRAIPVGAGLPAMDSGAPRLSRSHALSLTTIAGKPAPMYGLAPTVYPLLKNRCPVASMY
jgi:hypothetical protein